MTPKLSRFSVQIQSGLPSVVGTRHASLVALVQSRRMIALNAYHVALETFRRWGSASNACLQTRPTSTRRPVCHRSRASRAKSAPSARAAPTEGSAFRADQATSATVGDASRAPKLEQHRRPFRTKGRRRAFPAWPERSRLPWATGAHVTRVATTHPNCTLAATKTSWKKGVKFR